MKKMKKYLLFLGAILLVLTSCATTRNSHSGNSGDRGLHPDEVFTVTDDDIAHETLQINRALDGEWKYNGPAVDVSGKNLLAGIGKPIAKGKLKKKLKNAFKKIGLEKARPQFAFNNDCSCAIRLLGVNLNGKYNYNPDTGKITFKWHGVPMSANLKRDGKKKLRLTFETDKLLRLLSLASRVSDSSSLKVLSTLLDNYEDIMVGFELKR